MSRQSDLAKLPPKRLLEGACRFLKRQGWSFSWRCPVAQVAHRALDEGGFRVVALIAEPEELESLTEAVAAWVASNPSVTSRLVIDLRVEPEPMDGLFPDALAETPLEIWGTDELIDALLEESGDALAAWDPRPEALAEQLAEHELLLRFLDRELVADQYTRLSSAGGDARKRTALSRVFVDLRTSQRRDPDETEEPALFVRDTLAKASRPRSFFEPVSALGIVARHLSPEKPQPIWRSYEQRVLLIGGPGQGKTTLGVYLCQLYRTALLEGRAGLTPECEVIADALRRGPGALPVVGRRLPLRVVLHDYADALARGDVDDIWGWLSHYATVRAEWPISPGVIREWLKAWPALLVLDGLDEVPATANRAEVLATIHSFLGALESDGRDVVAMATTRPQGYRDEFRVSGWEHATLQPLETAEATEYASRLLEVWTPNDVIRRAELLRRVEGSVSDSATSHLARSPLQVAILCVLVDQLGRPPNDRWRLFREYYRIISDRERERGIASVEVLRGHTELVERLHAEVGYRLHLAAERAQGTASAMNIVDLRALIVELLEEDGYIGEERDRLARDIEVAALERLVFLVGLADDQVGFEVRSLQEFHAAERLFLGAEALVIRRLEAIAASAHWRNTLLFAAGRIAAERTHLLTDLLGLCDHLDGLERGLGERAGLGRRLALDLLSEGAIARLPRATGPLIHRVLEAIEAWRNDEQELIVANLAPADAEVLREALIAAMERSVPQGWDVAIRWAVAGNAEIRRAVEVRWLKREQEVADALMRLGSVWWGDEGFEKFAKANWHLLAIIPFEPFRWHPNSNYINVRFKIESKDNPDIFWLIVPIDSSTAISYHQFLTLPSQHHNTWYIFQAIAVFFENPHHKTLAQALRLADKASQNGLFSMWSIAEIAPWPLAACLQNDPSQLIRLADCAERGDLGTIDDWRKAETRWFEGLSPEDLNPTTTHDLPFTPKIANSGHPPVFGQWYALLYAALNKTIKNHIKTTTLLSGKPIDSWKFEGGDDSPIWEAFVDLGCEPVLTRGIKNLHDELWISRLERFYRASPWFGVRVHPIETEPDQIATLAQKISDFPHFLIPVASSVLFQKTNPSLLNLQNPESYPNNTLRALATTLQAANITKERAPLLADKLLHSGEDSEEALNLTADLLRKHTPLGALELFLHIPKWLETQLPLLQHLLTSRPTSLLTLTHAEVLGLPADRPPLPLTPTPSTNTLTHLHTLRISDLRAWRSLSLAFDPPEDRGQWIFVVGENGTGKTTLLRGLALALVEPTVAGSLLTRTPGDLVRNGQTEAKLEIALSGDQTTDVILRDDGFVSSAPRPDLFLVGYGPRRGTILGVTDKEMSFQPGDAVETLFVEGGNLIHAESWLKRLDHRASRDPGGADRGLLDAVKVLLKRLLPGVKRIEITPDEVRVSGPGVGDVPLQAVSDGYLTTAGWVVDLVARWMERERNAGRRVPPDFARQITGLVLIDEVDLHLHPRWQWSLVHEVRAIFPNLSFVVTTHNPITLLGAEGGEVWVIARDERGQLEATRRPVPAGADAGRLLTGAWFGLPSTLKRETLELLDRHRALLRDDPDSEEAKALEADLRQRLSRFPDTALENMVWSVISEELSERAEELTLSQRERARERARAMLKRMREERG